MSGGVIKIVIIFFDILAVIALLSVEAEESLFQNGIVSVPEGRSEADILVAVTEAGDAVFPPAVGSGARMVVRKVIPGCAIGAIVLTHRSPLPLAHIRPPAFPVDDPPPILFQSIMFSSHMSALLTTLLNDSANHNIFVHRDFYRHERVMLSESEASQAAG